MRSTINAKRPCSVRSPTKYNCTSTSIVTKPECFQAISFVGSHPSPKQPRQVLRANLTPAIGSRAPSCIWHVRLIDLIGPRPADLLLAMSFGHSWHGKWIFSYRRPGTQFRGISQLHSKSSTRRFRLFCLLHSSSLLLRATSYVFIDPASMGT
ncbi:hypothetical protein BO86DRAFT_94383 [Aspergillus japonicus CBS 114.51]|uniref:Uncharacterized protein n=2 Tax=Aspergillus TaxID=5052 RepID=A0A2V5HFX6_ASPV1|nr:hypothetical protein BO86DRAFT_94383 [Aspergillus japonicus CBS 114.51]PYI20724.1 hypothetical protein BO99DRAFT_105570 [Aspergillus violaceofuscus CBS 115571]RAH81843.1 hypothetical protein BO86DRAFT_94383 [Aspergillus japonicus CBS 114.51]